MSTSQHTWSAKTLQHFPPLIRDILNGRSDKRVQAIQAWKQVAVISQYSGLFSFFFFVNMNLLYFERFSGYDRSPFLV